MCSDSQVPHRLQHCSDPPRELASALWMQLANRQPGRDVVQVHGAAKCQENQHHNIHLPQLTGQVSNQDALGLVVQTAWCQSKALLRPMPSQMEGSWVTACTQAFGQTPARPWNILNVPQQRPQWPLVRTVCIMAHPAGLVPPLANREETLPTECGWGRTPQSILTSHLVPQVDLAKWTEQGDNPETH